MTTEQSDSNMAPGENSEEDTNYTVEDLQSS